MLFCLNARNDSLLGYYDSAQPTLSVQGIPDNLDLVYWDYCEQRLGAHARTNASNDRKLTTWLRSLLQLIRPYIQGKLREPNREPLEAGEKESVDGSWKLDLESLLDGLALYICHM